MKRLKIGLVPCLVVVVSIAVLLATVTRLAQAQAAPWTVVASPGVGTLNAVASISANDVWAVGVNSTLTTLAEHWNGTAWSVVPSPTVANGKFLGVAGAATNDVWAVGFTVLGAPPLIAHWDGKSWRTAKAPKQAGVLNAVTAVSTNDVWAVGDFTNASGVQQTLIEQWNGKRWGVVSSPSVGRQPNELLGVTAVSATDIWAVGFTEPSPNFFVTLTLHWDGTSWSVVSSPSAGTLRAVAAVSTNDVWAVGDAGGNGQALIEQWNGTSWSVVASQEPSTSTNTFHGVAVGSATDIWAVGDFIDNTTFTFQTLIEQWNGTTWSVVPSPDPSASENTLDAAAADPSSGQAWAVGEFFNNTSNVRQTLTEFNP